MNKEQRIRKYDKQVKMYEGNRKNQKLVSLRKKLIKEAYGKVLEVGVGAGANFPYYSKDKVDITGVDFSSEMIKSAKKTAFNYQVNVNFIQEDMDELIFEDNSFDCIVSTLSLCSAPNPVATLNKFNGWCREGGSILLMEHGLSSRPFFSLIQNVIDPIYDRLSGCHCNRDFNEILKNSNLQVDKIERYWSDLVYLIVAKPVKCKEGENGD